MTNFPGGRNCPLILRSLEAHSFAPARALETTHLLVATDRLAPTGAGQGAIGRRSTEKRIDFLEGGRAAAPMAASASLSAGAADPAAPLNIFAKRLKRLESRSYEDWCRRTLGLQIL